MQPSLRLLRLLKQFLVVPRPAIDSAEIDLQRDSLGFGEAQTRRCTGYPRVLRFGGPWTQAFRAPYLGPHGWPAGG